MNKRPLYLGGPLVHPLGFGGGHVGSPDQDEDFVGDLLNRLVDLGVNFFDTARGYGLSEERIGRHLSWRRKDLVFSTKVGYGIEGYESWTYDIILRGIDEALKRLQTDYIDVVFLHTCHLDVLKRGDVIKALQSAKDQGLIRAMGYSGENDELRWALWDGGFDVIQCSVNLADQRVIQEVLPEAVKRQVGVIAKRPLANAPWRFSQRPLGEYCENYWLRLQSMNITDLAEASGGWEKLALKFTAFTPGVSACIVGTTNWLHMKENMKILETGPLNQSLWDELRRRFMENDENWRGEV